jgi:hypothetical protein
VTEQLSRVEAAEAVASRWKELGIAFVIAHGVEDYPDAIGRDLDIHMDPRHAHRALEEARQTLTKAGWPTVVCPPPLWGARLVALTPDGDDRYEYLEFHTAAGFAWLALPLVTADVSATSRVGPFPVNSWTTFAKAVLLPLLAGDTFKFTPAYLQSTWRHLTAADEIESRLGHVIGFRLATELLDAARSQDSDRLRLIRSDVRRRCLLYMLAHPFSSATGVWPFLRKRLGRIVSNSGARVRLATPPGVDAHDIALDIAKGLEHVFVVIRVDSPGRWPKRLAQQYGVLSRQGLVLEVAEESSQGQITLTALRGTRPLQPAASFSTSESTEAMGAWILNRWAHSLRCQSL